MTLLVPWIVFPLVLGSLALGCGIVLDRVAGGRIERALVLPTGLAAVTVVAGFTTLSPRTAPWTIAVVVAVAALGIGLGRRSAPGRSDVAAGACALVAFLAVGAPVLASGEATFTGYVKLDDTATFLALTDRTLEHGRDVDGLAPSSYEATLSVNLAHGYPTGSLLPLGVAARIVGTDPAWLYQPYLALLAAMLALCLHSLAGRLVRPHTSRAFVACVASQPALLYGFAMWGGVKELYAAATLALVAATLPLARRGTRTMLAPATAAAALVLALSLGAVVWLVPAGIAVVVARRRIRSWLVAFALVALLALPTVLEAAQFLRADNRGSFRDDGELGNLIEPLSPFQVLGIWPSGDFRIEPAELRTTVVLLAAALVAALFGSVAAVRHRASGVVVYGVSCLVGAAVILALGSPWIAAKALAVAAPGAVLLALVGTWSLVAMGRRVEGLVLAAAITGGVLWSNVLAFQDASLAPRKQLAELETIGSRFAGEGPALMTEYQPYGVRHFLRRLDAEGASELRRRPVSLRSGRQPAKGESPDLDALATDAVLVYRTIVLRRTPAASRPPVPYARTWRGRFYDVWQRQDSGPRVLTHVPLGNVTEIAARTSCTEVERLARIGRVSDGLLVAAGPRAGVDAPVYVAPSHARLLCGDALDWLEVVQP
jgi:hypothetical protein